MKPILAILAHQSAQPSVDDFMPRWKALNVPLVCYVPDGDSIEGDFDDVCRLGTSAHSGAEVYKRFLWTVEDLLRGEHDWFIIAEYDTVPLRAEPPQMVDGNINCYAVMDTPHNRIVGEMQLCMLSPWVMDRQTAEWFVSAAKTEINKEPDPPRFYGLLDRWIGHVCRTHEIPACCTSELFGYPIHPGAHEKIRRMNYNWIHGWKRKEQFEDLWQD